MLFSEPKIPQCRRRSRTTAPRFKGFSALQRAENSSIVPVSIDELAEQRVSVLFSEPKIPQSLPGLGDEYLYKKFQCSSASRKFLNRRQPDRCVNDIRVSVLFSEPKIPQCRSPTPPASRAWVSVLFSEPKIPQSSG